jgi:hypothetical protein
MWILGLELSRWLWRCATAKGKQVTVAYMKGGCKREQRNETMTWTILVYVCVYIQTWGTDATARPARTGTGPVATLGLVLTRPCPCGLALHTSGARSTAPAISVSPFATQQSRCELKGEGWIGWRHDTTVAIVRSGDMAGLYTLTDCRVTMNERMESSAMFHRNIYNSETVAIVK